MFGSNRLFRLLFLGMLLCFSQYSFGQPQGCQSENVRMDYECTGGGSGADIWVCTLTLECGSMGTVWISPFGGWGPIWNPDGNGTTTCATEGSTTPQGALHEAMIGCEITQEDHIPSQDRDDLFTCVNFGIYSDCGVNLPNDWGHLR